MSEHEKGQSTQERPWSLCTTRERDERFDRLAPEHTADGEINKTTLCKAMGCSRQSLYTYMYDREARDAEATAKVSE